MKRKLLLRFVVVGFALLGALVTEVLANGGSGPRQQSFSAAAGERIQVASLFPCEGRHGGPIPYQIKVSVPPKHGNVIVRRDGPKTYVFYESKKGYAGQDSFQYVRVANDPEQGAYTIAVTVR